MPGRLIKFVIDLPVNFLRELEKDLSKSFAVAMTNTFERGAEDLRARSIENIATSGGPDTKLWQKLLSVKVFPENQISGAPAIFLNLKPRYSNIFEEGGAIKGFPILWLPLPTVPRKAVGEGQPLPLTPTKLAQSGVKLTSLGTAKRGKRNPGWILGTNIRTTQTPPYSEFTTSQLASGTTEGFGKVKGIPLYIAQRDVKIDPKFDIRLIAAKVTANMIGTFNSELQKSLRD